jgi:hypothetical protein
LKLHENLIPGVKIGASIRITSEHQKHYNFKRYITLHNDTAFDNFSTGGNLFSQSNRNLHWNIGSQYYINGYYKGNYSFNAEINKIFRSKSDSLFLNLEIKFAKNRPRYLEQHYYSNRFIWDEELTDIVEKRLKVSVQHPRWFIETGINYGIFDNYLYYTANAYPAQIDSPISILSVYINKDLHFWKFTWRNRFIYQTVDENLYLKMPTFIMYSSLYIQHSFIGKKTGINKMIATIQAGFDVYYNSRYYSPAYMPATGRFHLQYQNYTGDYPLVNAFINARIKRLVFFSKFEHLTSLLADEGELYYPIAHYPIGDFAVKFGISWKFND